MKYSEDLEELANRVDNLRYSLCTRVSSEVHIAQMKVELDLLYRDLKNLYIKETGENPWGE